MLMNKCLAAVRHCNWLKVDDARGHVMLLVAALLLFSCLPASCYLGHSVCTRSQWQSHCKSAEQLPRLRDPADEASGETGTSVVSK